MRRIGPGLLLILFLLGINHPGLAQSVTPVDPQLESGFPVQAFYAGGSYQTGPVLLTLVANIDYDPQLEIISSAMDQGPLYAWNFDGSLVPGWPANENWGVGYPAAGNLAGSANSLEVYTDYWQGKPIAYSGSGAPLPGWPLKDTIWGVTPPVMADVNGDGLDEIFSSHSDAFLYGYRADGSTLPGWPVWSGFSSQEIHSPAIADLDGDGKQEIVFVTGHVTSGILLVAVHDDGTPVQGFPILIANGDVDTFPVIGDVDGDGCNEVVMIDNSDVPPYPANVRIYSGSGQLKQLIPVSGEIDYGTAPALADLDGDSVPEIIVETETYLNVWKGDGSPVPGWPVDLGREYAIGTSIPVIGDVDGDLKPEIVITPWEWSSGYSELRVYKSDGTFQPQFQKVFNRVKFGLSAAIADIDLDGRNEIIITGNKFDGIRGFFDRLWVYDLGGGQHGDIEWGQFGGGPEHRGVYPVPFAPVVSQPERQYVAVVMQPIQKLEPGIHGRVLVTGQPAQSIAVNLRLFDGASWNVVASLPVDANGRFSFTNVPDLEAGQSYDVFFQNQSNQMGILAFWQTRSIGSYHNKSDVDIGDFSIEDVAMAAPQDGAGLTFPADFGWEIRNVVSTEFYDAFLADPGSGDLLSGGTPVRGNYGITYSYLPDGLYYGLLYNWGVMVFSPDGGYGLSRETRSVYFRR